MHLIDVLAENRVTIDRDVQSKKGVIEHLAQLFAADIEGLTASDIFDALIAREKLGSTGLGNGVAIPHGRVKGTDRAYAALLIADNTVDFDAIDNNPVDIFFGLLVPEEANEEHLKLLAELAELLADERLTRRLRNALSPARVHEVIAKYEAA